MACAVGRALVRTVTGGHGRAKAWQGKAGCSQCTAGVPCKRPAPELAGALPAQEMRGVLGMPSRRQSTVREAANALRNYGGQCVRGVLFRGQWRCASWTATAPVRDSLAPACRLTREGLFNPLQDTVRQRLRWTWNKSPLGNVTVALGGVPPDRLGMPVDLSGRPALCALKTSRAERGGADKAAAVGAR